MSSRAGLGLSNDYMKKAFAKGNRTLQRQRIEGLPSQERARETAGGAAAVTKANDTTSKSTHKTLTESTTKKRKAAVGAFAGMSAGFLSKPRKAKTPVSCPSASTRPSTSVSSGRHLTGTVSDTAPTSSPPSSGATSTSSTAQPPRVPFIKAGAKGTEADRLRFKEVEEAMQGPASSFLQERESEWLTPDLLDQVTKDPVLSQMMTNPNFANVLAEFQANPRETLQKYDKDGGAMGEFLKRFCGLMGAHMGEMADKDETKGANTQKNAQQAPSQPLIEKSKAGRGSVMDEAHFQRVVQDKQVQAVFQMPAVQELFALMQTNPDAAQTVLRTNKDPRFQRAVGLLVSKGLFQIQT